MHIVAQHSFVSRHTIVLRQNDTCIASNRIISSFVIRAQNQAIIESVRVSSFSAEFFPKFDVELSNEIASSELIFTPSNTTKLCFSSKANVTISVDFLHVPNIVLQKKEVLKADDCQKPPIIAQTEWRVGLTEPNYNRSETKTNNVIIHHSAGSNTDTDYTNVVRNIYVYHTESNKWSDIAYNYLIAQDGTIFAGRDPNTFAQDEVLGAHFCGSNSGTMGICLLGNYETASLPSATQQSLVELLSWKCLKDTLNPISIQSHVLNNNLPVIAGHRNGCSTQCPGKNAYSQLPTIRNQTLTRMQNCGYVVPTGFLSVLQSTIFMQSDDIMVFSLLGNCIYIGTYGEFILSELSQRFCIIKRIYDGSIITFTPQKK